MKRLLYVLGAIALAALLWFAHYAISPLFINIKADEALPQAQTPAPEAMPADTRASVPGISAQTASALVIGTPAHPASGSVRLVEADGKAYVRYENYKTINGPDLYVYLAKDLDAKEFVDLGRIKATEGNINYEIPAGVDTFAYRYVLTWCKAFSVLFNYADLSAAR